MRDSTLVLFLAGGFEQRTLFPGFSPLLVDRIGLAKLVGDELRQSRAYAKLAARTRTRHQVKLHRVAAASLFKLVFQLLLANLDLPIHELHARKSWRVQLVLARGCLRDAA